MQARRFSGDGTHAIGSYGCEACGFVVVLTTADDVPACPECGGRSFVKSSMFGLDQADAHQTVEQPALSASSPAPNWLDEIRRGLAPSSACLVAGSATGSVSYELTQSWTRIGRSVAAGIRLDDPTVSRRHAIVVHHPRNGVHILDDRSVNGIYVNGSRAEWAELSDGDEVRIGRFTLWVCEPGGSRAVDGSSSTRRMEMSAELTL